MSPECITSVSTNSRIPTIINGGIDHPDDQDRYSFQGHAGESLVAEIVARRLDSPGDSYLTLTDDTGQTIAFNDDYEDKSEVLLTHQADSRLQATLPRDGLYQLTVTDTQHHGGSEYGYRLIVRPPQPDFELRVTPSAVNIPMAASVLGIAPAIPFEVIHTHRETNSSG